MVNSNEHNINSQESPNSGEKNLSDAIKNASFPTAIINILNAETTRINEIIKNLSAPNSTASFTDLPEANGLRAIMRERISPKMIRETQTFDELYDVLDKISEIPYSNGKLQSAQDWIGIINKVRDGSYDIDRITRTYGLRDAVIRLLDKKFEPNNPPLSSGAAMSQPKYMSQESEDSTLNPVPDDPKEPSFTQQAHPQSMQPISDQENMPIKPEPDGPMSPASNAKIPLFQNIPPHTSGSPDNLNSPSPEKISKKNPNFYRPNNLFPEAGLKYNSLKTTKTTFQHAAIIRYTPNHVLIKPFNEIHPLEIPTGDLIDPRTGKPFKTDSNNNLLSNQNIQIAGKS